MLSSALLVKVTFICHLFALDPHGQSQSNRLEFVLCHICSETIYLEIANMVT